MDVRLRVVDLSRFTPTVGAKQASYKLWFNCKHVTRKMKRALGVSKAGSVYLPQEIVDCILDYVSEDRPTLLACTHLSHTWCIGARLHLFRTFTVSDSSGFEAINEIQDMKTIYLVRKLVIAQRMSQSDLIIPKITTRLNTFTHLQDLDIRYLNVGELLAWLPQHCGVLKSTLRTLTLRYPRGSTKQILCFVSLFSSLENLAVDNIEQESASDAVVPFPESSPPLTGRLTLTGILDQEFMSGLASLQKGLKFRTLDLQFCGEAQEVIDGCAGTLRRFICHPSDFRGKSNSPLISRRHTLTSVDRYQELGPVTMRFPPPRRSQLQRPHPRFPRPTVLQLHLHCPIISTRNVPYRELR